MRVFKYVLALMALLLPGLAISQTSPGLVFGQIPTAAQWNSYFAGKLDYPGMSRFRPAVMSPKAGQVISPTQAWNALDPFGNPINCSGTTTQCLQEFINTTAANGWPAEVHCQGIQFPSHLEPIFIDASSPISVPAVQDWDFYADSTCNLTVIDATASALTLDSEGASRFVWDGKIVYIPSAPSGVSTTTPSCVVYLNPHTNTADGFAAIYAGLVRVKTPVSNPSSGTATGVICFNASAGNFIQQNYDFTEVNGENTTAYGIFIFGASITTGFQQNVVNVNQIHGVITAGLNEGYASTNQGNYNSNTWTINNIENSGASSRGVDEWGSYDNFNIGIINNAQGGLQYGILTEASANYNNFVYGLVSGNSGSAIVDGGIGNSFYGYNTVKLRLDPTNITSIGPTPAVTGTGSPTIVAGSSDAAGEVQAGSSATSVVITFSGTHATTPFCIVTPQTANSSFSYGLSTTAITIIQSAASEKISYHCFNHNP